MRVRIFCNPTAGRGRSARTLERATSRLQGRGAIVEIVQSTSSEHLTEMASHHEDGFDRVVVIGGDGTIHHLLRRFPLTATALGIIPSGSGDDLAAALGLPRDVDKACDVILAGKVRQIDLAEANGIRYSGVAGLGFDSIVARHANSVRRLRGSIVYLWSIFRVLPQFRPIRLQLTADGTAMEHEAMFAVVANSSRYGGGIQIAPRAELDDQILELYVTLRCSKLTLLRTLPLAYSGKHVNTDLVRHVRGRDFRIDSDQKLEVYADGEFVTTTPVEFRLATEKLSVYVP